MHVFMHASVCILTCMVCGYVAEGVCVICILIYMCVHMFTICIMCVCVCNVYVCVYSYICIYVGVHVCVCARAHVAFVCEYMCECVMRVC